MIRRMKVMICLFLILCLSGCWDRKELNEVGVVMGVGIDKADNNQYEVTAQIIKAIKPGQGSSGGSDLPTWSVSAKGKTIMNAIKHLNQATPRHLYWPHLQLIIFGEDLAREGIAPVITWFERDRDSRSGAYLVVTQGKANDLLNQKIELEGIPAKAISDFLERSTLRQITPRKIKLRDLMQILSSPGVDPSLDVINPKMIRGKVETYQLSGTAVFNGDKMVGVITGATVSGAAIRYNEYHYAVVDAKCPGDDDEFFSFQVTDFQNKVKPIMKEDKLTMKMDIFMEGNLIDQTCSANLLEPDKEIRVEEQIATNINTYVKECFQQAAKMGADIYGVGQDLRRHYPEIWKQKQEQEAWESFLNKVTLEINVDVNVRRSGLLMEPTQSKMK